MREQCCCHPSAPLLRAHGSMGGAVLSTPLLPFFSTRSLTLQARVLHMGGHTVAPGHQARNTRKSRRSREIERKREKTGQLPIKPPETEHHYTNPTHTRLGVTGLLFRMKQLFSCNCTDSLGQLQSLAIYVRAGSSLHRTYDL